MPGDESCCEDHESEINHLLKLAGVRVLDAAMFGYDVKSRIASDGPLLALTLLEVFQGQTEEMENLIETWSEQEEVRSTWRTRPGGVD